MTTIAVGVDGSTASLTALHWAAAEATSRAATLRILVARSAPADWPHDSAAHTARLEASLQTKAEHALALCTPVLAAFPTLTVSPEVRISHAAELLLTASHEVDLVVVGGRGLGPLRGALAGSVTAQLAGLTACPLIVIRDLPAEPAALVVVGVDGNSSSTALAFAFAHAARIGATLRAVWCWHGGMSASSDPELFAAESWQQDNWQPAYEAALQRILAPLRAEHPDVIVDIVVQHGQPAKVLAEQAHGADLLVVGARGRGGFAGLSLGSVALSVLHHVPRPVAVVPRPPAPTTG